MRNKKFISLLAIILLLAACNNYSKTDKGLKFKFLKRSQKLVLPNVGEFLQCYYSITNSEDSIVFSNFDQTPDRILLVAPTHKGGDIMDALGMMTEGDSAQFLISADSFFLKSRLETALPSFIKKGSNLKFIIKMDRKITEYQKDSLVNAEKIAKWSEEIANTLVYVKKNGLVVQLDSSNGIRAQFHSKAYADTAKRVTENSVVKFHFIASLLDGTEFYNSYTMGSPQIARVIKSQFQPIGMYEMLIKMNQGDKATFILPYDLGFGAKGAEGVIPPFATLVYKINILKVEKK